MTKNPPQPQIEMHFYLAATKALEAQTGVADRLIDGIRAAMLLSAYVYTSGRFHEVRPDRDSGDRASADACAGLAAIWCCDEVRSPIRMPP